MDDLCLAVMPGHDPAEVHCCRRRRHDGPLHEAPATLDPSSRFAGLSVSWHDPLPPSSEEYEP